jgi:hypothetical protein
MITFQDKQVMWMKLVFFYVLINVTVDAIASECVKTTGRGKLTVTGDAFSSV